MTKTCKIIINDEVKCKIEGLDAVDRRNLSKKFEYEIPGAKYIPSVALGRWDGKVKYFSISGSTFINLLPEILNYLAEKNYEFELEDNRVPNTFSFETIDENFLSDCVWPAGHPKAGEKIQLRDYQVEVINMFLEHHQGIQEIATGAGKTIITSVLSKKIEKYGRSLVIVPSKNLVIQTEEDFKNVGLDVGVYFGDRKEYNHQHTICTWQGLNFLLSDEEKPQEEVDGIIKGLAAVIVDECHTSKSDVLKSILTGPLAHVPIRWGLTGTVPKDKFAYTALFVSIGANVNALSASELQNKGVLANCQVNIIQLKDGKVHKTHPDEARFLSENKERLATIGGLVNNISASGNTLILVDRLATGKALEAMVPDSVFIHGSTKLKERKQEFDEVAVIDNKVIIATYGVAAVGINMPRIFNLILVDPGKSFVRVIQSIGRGLRRASDKDFVEIYDITSDCKFSKRHLTQRKAYYKEAGYKHTVTKLEYQ